MSKRILPLLYLNLGGEMLYVLDQRLTAQKVPGNKSVKVLDDIASTMFNRKFLEEIFFRHQALHSRRVLRVMFDRLAHASIMRLNEQSMDKLYDLMVMAFKHQVMMSKNPHHLVMITLNHLDAMMDYAKSEQVKKNIELAYELLLQSYCTLTTWEMHSIRYSILNFLQDYKVRVSIFLNEGKQKMDGSFKFGPPVQMIKGVRYPGNVRYFDSNGEVMAEDTFPSGLTYSAPGPQGGLGLHEIGNRGTVHGLNMYGNFKEAPFLHSSEASGKNPEKSLIGEEQPSTVFSHQKYFEESFKKDNKSFAKEELNLLAQLLGNNEESVGNDKQDTFKLNLFGSKNPENSSGANKVSEDDDEESCVTMKFDLKSNPRGKSAEISNIIGEMKALDTKDDDNDKEDLLALMDQAK